MEHYEQLEKIRHSLAHVLASAVLEFYPKTKLAIGPAIENGFYYDMELPVALKPEDLQKIESRMRELIRENQEFTGKKVTKITAKKLFNQSPYKLEIIKELKGKTVGTYQNGSFVDLCRGGHVDNTSEIDPNAFKLTKIAGAYWRGNEKNKMLTRVYGVAFTTSKELQEYLAMQEEAEKRDHKILGPKLELFAFSELVGPGLPLFLPKGMTLIRELEEFVRTEKIKRGYSFVRIPHIAKSALYKKSGHLGKYDAMMPIMKDAEGNESVMKAMNCPHHFEMYNSQPHSYRGLPLRLAETTTVYRNEKSGELSGLLRVKALTQDDTHHFVRHDQIEAEIEMILDLMHQIYQPFHFSDFLVQISIRDPKDKKKYFGSDDLWKKSESILIEAVKRWGKPYVIEEGEAAFYGPKIDIMVKDAIGRSWQLTTVQLDFNQPENFDMHYIGEDGQKHRPAVLHVAILGSVERFLGVLIEHTAGSFPTWLSPVQVAIIPISDKHHSYAAELGQAFSSQGLRFQVMKENETLGKKIREAEMQKIPYLLIVGDKEMEANKVSVRARGKGDLGQMDSATCISKIAKEVAEKQ